MQPDIAADDRAEPPVDLLVGIAGPLVGAGDVGDGQPFALGDGEQLVGAVIIVGHVPCALGRRVARDRRLVDDRAAADRIRDLAVERLAVRRRRR